MTPFPLDNRPLDELAAESYSGASPGESFEESPKQSLKEDRELVDFLQRYQPLPPPPAANLEVRILTALSPQHTPVQNKRSPWSFLWMVPSAIALGIVVTWSAGQLLSPSPPSAAELVELETYVEDSWDGVFSPSSQSELDAEDEEVLLTTF